MNYRHICSILLLIALLPVFAGCANRGADGITVREYQTDLAKKAYADTASLQETTAAEESPQKADSADTIYILNTSSKKIHLPSCSSAKDMSPENEDSTTDFAAAVEAGYSPCGRCKPTA